MSGEVDYRRYAGTPSPKPKYLSDSLTPWYGAWTSVVPLTIEYTNLPPDGTILAKLVVTAGNAYGDLVFTFNAPQNLLTGSTIEYWLRVVSGALGGMFFYMRKGPNNYYRAHLPAVWTKYTYPIPDPASALANPSPPGPSRTNIAQSVSGLLFDHSASVNSKFEVAGVNIRRLP